MRIFLLTIEGVNGMTQMAIEPTDKNRWGSPKEAFLSLERKLGRHLPLGARVHIRGWWPECGSYDNTLCYERVSLSGRRAIKRTSHVGVTVHASL